MESYEVLREAADKVGVKAMASALKLSPALIYKWCEEADTEDPDASGTRNPLDRLRDIVKLTGHIPVVQWFCQEAGGFFVFNPAMMRDDIDADLLQSTHQLIQSFSVLLNEISRDVADDGHIEPGEARRIREDWEGLKTTAESFVVACEKGVYRRKKR